MTRKKLSSDLENRRNTDMKLQRWQARKINRALQPTVGYLCRLRERMEKVGFLNNDPLFQLVKQSYDNLQALYMKLHYLSCESGVGVPGEQG
jgi:hypothetical protein